MRQGSNDEGLVARSVIKYTLFHLSPGGVLAMDDQPLLQSPVIMDPLTLSNKTVAPVPAQQGFLRSIDLSDSKATARLVFVLLPFPFLIHYLVGLAFFHWAHLRPKDKQVPPTWPHLVPLLGSALPFAFDCVKFIQKATYVLRIHPP